MNILDLPDTVLMDILEMLSYDEIARKREVCARFNCIAQQVLNMGFNKVVQEHAKHFKRIKALLPRRESERRNHMLARHSDILTSIETRISMLTMTYSKFIDLNICCFIPGRVLDEINNILKLLSGTSKPLRPHEVLQELRDISSMAIEHFDEKIARDFKARMKQVNESSPSASPRVMVCGSLGEISFNGVNVNGPMRQSPLSNMLRINPNGDPLMQQALMMANILPNSDIETNYLRARLTRQLQRQWQNQKVLTTKVRFLEGTRKKQDRRLQEAVSSINELSSQVSELKRQLEDSLGKGGASNSRNDSMPPAKKPRDNNYY